MLFKMMFVSLTVALFSGEVPAPSTRDAPFIETFQRDGKTLVYVLTIHHSPLVYPDAMADPVFKTIARVFLNAPPEAVIVEGVDPASMSGFLEHANECAAENYNVPDRPCDEPTFAAYCALKAGASIYTGEPSAAASLSLFEAHGYSIEDFLAFWVMNNVPQKNVMAN